MLIAALVALGLIVFFLTLTVMELCDRVQFVEQEHGRQLLRLMQRIGEVAEHSHYHAPSTHDFARNLNDNGAEL